MARRHLENCGWAWDWDHDIWKYYAPRGFVGRWVMKGTAWLTGRSPRNKSLPLAKKNKVWRTQLYGLSIEYDKNLEWHIGLDGVRIWDVERFVTEVLGLSMDDVEIEYFRRLERYITLSAPDAHRVAELTASEPGQGRGRLARKEFLVRDHTVPVTIRKRTPAEVKVHVYRVSRGATCVYRCEAVLEGRRRDRSTFGPGDTGVLDEVLLDLVQRGELRPLHKPARWEPRTFNTTLERGDFDANMQKLGQKALRGRALKPAWIKEADKCHNPKAVVLVDVPPGAVTIPHQTRIRKLLQEPPDHRKEREGVHGELPELEDLIDHWGGSNDDNEKVASGVYEPRVVLPSGRAPVAHKSRPDFRLSRYGAWRSLAEEFRRLPPGLLVEVILDGDADPADALEALLADKSRSVGISHLCHRETDNPKDPVKLTELDAWMSVLALMAENPTVDNSNTWAIVVDTSAVMAVHKWVCDEEPEGGHYFPRMCGSMAAWLWNWAEMSRKVCEETGLTMVMVTTDTRPDHGRGDLRRSHFFRDGRVRSWVGDAGRYHAHQRYLAVPEAEGVVAIKDEVEGLPGRRLYRNPTVSW